MNPKSLRRIKSAKNKWILALNRYLRKYNRTLTSINSLKKFKLLKVGANDIEPLTSIESERDNGNCEYKLFLVDYDLDRLKHLTTGMKFRLNEGNGQSRSTTRRDYLTTIPSL